MFWFRFNAIRFIDFINEMLFVNSHEMCTVMSPDWQSMINMHWVWLAILFHFVPFYRHGNFYGHFNVENDKQQFSNFMYQSSLFTDKKTSMTTFD